MFPGHEGWGVDIVGCGGTFWCATPLLSALLKQMEPRRVRLFDPDVLEEKNLSRQWVNAEGLVARPDLIGTPKVVLAAKALGYKCELFKECFNLMTDLQDNHTLVIVNVDNNRSRVLAWERMSSSPYDTVFVVSGCDGGGGQVYYGVRRVYPSGGVYADYDWVDYHPDVQEDPGGEPRREMGCGGQTVYANAITGQLLGFTIMQSWERYTGGEGTPVKEWCWDYNSAKRLRVQERIIVKAYVDEEGIPAAPTPPAPPVVVSLNPAQPMGFPGGPIGTHEFRNPVPLGGWDVPFPGRPEGGAS